MGELLPTEIEDELRAALMKQQSGKLVVEFVGGSVYKAFIDHAITWERPRAAGSGKVERG